MSTACASRKVRSVGSALPSASVKRASASAPTTRPLARSTIGWKATSRPLPSISVCMRAWIRSRRCSSNVIRSCAARARSRSAIRFAVSSSSNSRSFSATAMKPISRPTAGIANWPARSARLAHHEPANSSDAHMNANASSPARIIIASTHRSAQDTAPPARRHQRAATPACAITMSPTSARIVGENPSPDARSPSG